MLFVYAGSGPGSARERHFHTPTRGTGSRRNSLTWMSSFRWNEWAAMFGSSIQCLTQTWFGYCLTCLLSDVSVEGQTYDAHVWLLLFNLDVNSGPNETWTVDKIFVSDTNKPQWNRLYAYFANTGVCLFEFIEINSIFLLLYCKRKHWIGLRLSHISQNNFNF